MTLSINGICDAIDGKAYATEVVVNPKMTATTNRFLTLLFCRSASAVVIGLFNVEATRTRVIKSVFFF